MPSPLAGNWTLRELLRITKEYKPNRFDYRDRDVVKGAVRIRKIEVYDGKNPGEARTKFIIESASYPQYRPYYTGKDKRGRKIKYQRTYRHQYLITLQLDKLSIDVPVKIRTGANRLYEFRPSPNLIKSKKNPEGKYLSVGDYNIEVKGINPDHFFTNEWVRGQEGILYGRDWTNGPPKITNPKMVPFLMKHEIQVIESLMNAGVLGQG